MNKKPVLLRTLLAIVVMVIFGAAMYPLTPRDYYDTFKSLLKDPSDKTASELIAAAKAYQAKDKDLFESQALLKAADERGVNLAPMVKGEGLENNRDVMSLIRKKASSSIRLGLDLNGGVEFYLELLPDEGKKEEIENDFKHYRDVAIEQLRKRLEQMGIFEAELAPSGERHIVLRAPIVTNDEKAKLRDMIQMSAKLHFRLVKDSTAEVINKLIYHAEHCAVCRNERKIHTERLKKRGDKSLEHYLDKLNESRYNENKYDYLKKSDFKRHKNVGIYGPGDRRCKQHDEYYRHTHSKCLIYLF